MATYNGERFLEEQLASFVRQTRMPDELVVTDDGSTDGTLEILKRFAATAPFAVHVHRNGERLNYSRNFERAIGLCSGDILFLSDQDDVWFPEKITSVTAKFMEEPGIAVIANDQILTDARLNHTGVTKLGNLQRIGKTSDSLIEGCCTAVRRSFAREVFPIPHEADRLIETRDLSHDRWLNELANLLRVRLVLRTPLQFFRRTGENTTSWVVSEPRRTGFRQSARARLPIAPTEAWLRRSAVLDLYETYLRSRRESLTGNMDAALRAIEHERFSIEQRVQIASLPPIRRTSAVWRLWRSGGYRYFEHWMSAANDLFRARRP